ncbi:unnamed protein product [Albugo candida]|uniref:Uncharacterized protein n=1 Tax=Albugo candida TaxID=65357 RepID=A0A024G2T1_9STRA|nr:unnamed protein product [Albugo candida]|eukprot:CCI40623.1 unnamed protein product [Albugo candida]
MVAMRNPMVPVLILIIVRCARIIPAVSAQSQDATRDTGEKNSNSHAFRTFQPTPGDTPPQNPQKLSVPPTPPPPPQPKPPETPKEAPPALPPKRTRAKTPHRPNGGGANAHPDPPNTPTNHPDFVPPKPSAPGDNPALTPESETVLPPPTTTPPPVISPPPNDEPPRAKSSVPHVTSSPQHIRNEKLQPTREEDFVTSGDNEESDPTPAPTNIQPSSRKRYSYYSPQDISNDDTPQDISNDDTPSEPAVDSDTSSSEWTTTPPESIPQSNSLSKPQAKPQSNLNSNSTRDPASNSSVPKLSGTTIIIYVVCIVFIVGLITGLLVMLVLRHPSEKNRDLLVPALNANGSASKASQPTQCSDNYGRRTSDIVSLEATAPSQYNNLSSTRSTVDNYAIPVSNIASMQPCYSTITSVARDSGNTPQEDSYTWASAVEPRKNQTTCTATPTYVSARESVGDLSLFAPTASSRRGPTNTSQRGCFSPLSMSSFGVCSQGSDISACVDSKFSDARAPGK